MSFEITGKDFHKDGVTEIHDLSKVHVPEEIQLQVLRAFFGDKIEPATAKRKQCNTHKEEIT